MDAIAGANSINYTIDDLHYYIDIYPYKLEITFENGEKFSIVDLDEICCIPIELGLGGKLEAKFIDSTNPDYPNLFGVIEKLIKNDDRIFAFYEFALFGSTGNSIEINTIKGAYVVLSNVKELKTIYERTDNGYIDTQYFVQDGEIFYKIGTDSRGGACVIVDRSYFPIWKLILILVLILLFIGLIILIILLILFSLSY